MAEQTGSLVKPNIPHRAGRREWIGLAVLALACVRYAMDLTGSHLAAAISVIVALTAALTALFALWNVLAASAEND